ncbi:hypothetical protein PO909_017426 [Leuciscus waleckii]
MEEWKAMKKTPRLEPGTGTENIAIIEHQCLNFQMENSEVVVTPRLTPRKPANMTSEYEIQEEDRLEAGTGTENIPINENQCLNFQVENSEVVVTPRLTPREPSEDNMQSKNKGRIMAFFQRSWQAIKQGFTRCLWPNEVQYKVLYL